MIATDIDGTLVNDNKEISPKTLAALKAARKKGVFVVLCTGRPVSGVKPYLEQLGLTQDENYVITYNGALATNIASGQVVVSNTLDYSDFTKLDTLSHELNVHGQAIQPSSDLYVTTPDISYYTVLDSFYTKMPLHYRPQAQIPTEFPMAKYMWADEPAAINQALPNLPTAIKEDYYTVRSEGWFFEFMHKDAHKGKTTLELANKLGIKPHEILTAGDQQNDLTLIQAGFGVAMGNAIPEIKDLAQYVTADNNHDGLGLAVEKFVL